MHQVAANGDSLWSTIYGAPGWYHEFRSIQKSTGNGYILAGDMGFGGPANMLLVKMDINGNVLWDQVYIVTDYQSAKSVKQTAEGGYIMAGDARPAGSSSNAFVVKTDSLGEFVWWHEYNSYSVWNDICVEITQTPEGGYFLACNADSADLGGFYAVKIDGNGAQQWDSLYTFTPSDVCNAGIPASPWGSGYIMAGSGENSIGLKSGYVVRLGNGSQMEMTIIPEYPQIIIPPGGGSFNFQISLTNHGQTAQLFDVWTAGIKPNGQTTAPKLGPIYNCQLGPGMTWTSTLKTQNVPGAAPPGTYQYAGFLGDYPDTVYSSNSFPVIKMGSGSDQSGDDWDLAGAEAAVPPDNYSLEVHPNPFNATAQIRFALPQEGWTRVAVYDVNGREVARLWDRWTPQGYFTVPWEASNLPSGIYFARLTTGGHSQSLKLLLVK